MIPPPVTTYLIDKEAWGTPFNPDDANQQKEPIVNGYITLMILKYEMSKYTDILLWKDFREDFEGWSLENFKIGNRTALKKLRDHLITHGVWIRAQAGSMSYAKVLYECLENNEQHQWIEKEISDHLLEYRGLFDSHWNPISSSNQNLITRNPQRSPSPTQQNDIKLGLPTIQEEFKAPSLVDSKSDPGKSNNQFQIPQYSENDVNNPTKLLTDLMKIYSHDHNKYGGEMYDFLDLKLQEFYDCCSKIGLTGSFHLAFSIMLKGRARNFYYTMIAGRQYNFKTMISMMKQHFETEENRQMYLSEWRATTLKRIIMKHPEKSHLECLELTIDILQKVQQGLPQESRSENILRDQLLNACQGVEECNLSLYKPANTFEGVCAELRSAVRTSIRSQETSTFNLHTKFENMDIQQSNNTQYWTDRRYEGRDKNFKQTKSYPGRNSLNTGSAGLSRGFIPNQQKSQRKLQSKRCYVCNKTGCWSTRHSVEERKKAYDMFTRSQYSTDIDVSLETYQTFLVQYEGVEGFDNEDTYQENSALLYDMKIEENCDNFFTELGIVNGYNTVAILNDQSFFHSLTKDDPFKSRPFPTDSTTFTFTDRYSSQKFQGIMPDSGAAGVSTAGEPQFQALKDLDSSIVLDTRTAGSHNIRFGKGVATSKGTTKVNTPLGTITFHVVPANTPFLLCLKDMDELNVKFDNLRNLLIQGDKLIPVVRKWGHPWMLLDEPEYTIAYSHLTTSELSQIHRRFGHPSVPRLAKILRRAGHYVNLQAIKYLTKFCHQCQLHGKSPGRFKFTLKDDIDFNYSIVVDVLYLSSKPVLHVVDSATSFNAARFLKDMSAKQAWDTLRECWIDTYQGPPEYVVHDAGKNFSSDEFRQKAKSLSITVKEVPVEAHNSVGLVERYHAPLRRAYQILCDELQDEKTTKEAILQMAVKAVNDSAGPNGIIPTLLVFGAYPRMTEDDLPSPSLAKRAKAINQAMKEVRRLQAERQVNEALAMRNGPNIISTLNLPLNSDVRVWREYKGWTGPFKLTSINGDTCIVSMPHGPANFRITSVKPYFIDEQNKELKRVNLEGTQAEGRNTVQSDHEEEQEQAKEMNEELKVINGQKVLPISVEKQCRPKRVTTRPKRFLDGYEYYLNNDKDLNDQFNAVLQTNVVPSMVFLSNKEKYDRQLSIRLRQEGVITTPGEPFEQSQTLEIDGLIARGVFEFIKFDPKEHSGLKIFNSRLVNEIKGKATKLPYEKSRLVVQAYDDQGKEAILTQSPTIQRVSQRIIVALAPSLAKIGYNLYLRDITQAYIQSTTLLKRKILARLPKEIRNQYPVDTIMVVRKPLYGIPEAGTHWWATYHRHHIDRLHMITSTYDPCFLITKSTNFGIVGMQTDDTLILGCKKFAELEDSELKIANLTAKPKEELSHSTPLNFNGCVLSKKNGNIYLRQKEQGSKLKTIDPKSPFCYQEYIEQRARGAYLATICQPEASFDLSTAAQQRQPDEKAIVALNKRLNWQMHNLDRGIQYVPLQLDTVKIFVFVDGSFANNQDLSSQLGYLIIMANEIVNHDSGYFDIHGNLIHWSSVKSKRVTRSVLASEIYGMVNGVDMAIAINTTMEIIMKQLSLLAIPIIVCTDSFSLYQCLVKLGTTNEKRLMIDIMALRQSYERRELQEIRWINGHDNPADSMTKSNPNRSLEKFLNSNQLHIRIEGWVDRE